MGRFYAGVGSRRTPIEIIEVMRYAAEALAADGWTLRSGHATGADQAFEEGAGGAAEIFLPWASFESGVPLKGKVFSRPTDDALRMAAEFHPRWEMLSRGARALHARNCHQVLGYDLQTPVTFLLAWTVPPFPQGGTGQAVRIALRHNIPVFDLGDSEAQWRVMRMIEHHKLGGDDAFRPEV